MYPVVVPRTAAWLASAMPEELTAEQAAARLQTDDTLGMPLGPGQPPAFLRALGEREDWTDLRVYGALLAVLTELFSRTGVHYLSGFFGPLERALRDTGADIEFTPADFRRFGPLLERQATARDDHRRHAARRRRLVLVVAARRWHDRRVAPRGRRSRPVARRRGLRRLPADVRARRKTHRHALHVDEIDILVRSTDAPLALPGGDAPPTDVDKAIARHAVEFIPSGATLQTGIGSIPNQIATLLAEGDGGDYGLHSEMFTDGCMQLHRAGKITNARKGQYDGVSVTTFAFGSPELYAWLDGNEDVAFLPVEIVNSPEVIGANDDMISVNGALAIDIHGQVVADTIGGDQFSGIGGAEDFVAGAGLRAVGPLADLPALDVREGRRAAVADRAVVRPRRRHHDAAAPRRRHHHRVRRRRTGGQDRPASAARHSRRSHTRSSVTNCSPPPSARRRAARLSRLKAVDPRLPRQLGGVELRRASRLSTTLASQGIPRSAPARARRRSRRA